MPQGMKLLNTQDIEIIARNIRAMADRRGLIMTPAEDAINMLRVTDRYRKALEIAQIYLEDGAPITALDRIRTGLTVAEDPKIVHTQVPK